MLVKKIESAQEVKIGQLSDLVEYAGHIHITKGFLNHIDLDVDQIRSRFNVISEYKNSIKIANKS